jgi:ubiquitin carboxyl-terminal hydrolase 14
VSVKWNKTSFDNLEIDPSLGVEVVKAQLFDLSNVPVDKQKLMFKGKILKVGAILLF